MQAADGAHQRRLAHAVAAEQGDHFAAADAQVDAVQHLAAGVARVDGAHVEQRVVVVFGSRLERAHSSPR